MFAVLEQCKKCPQYRYRLPKQKRNEGYEVTLHLLLLAAISKTCSNLCDRPIPG